jgi:hypothetical protein
LLILVKLFQLVSQLLQVQSLLGDPSGFRSLGLLQVTELVVKTGELSLLVFKLGLCDVMRFLNYGLVKHASTY